MQTILGLPKRFEGCEKLNFREASHILQKDFNKESDLCDYIELNIERFCEDCLGVKYGSHQREYKIDALHSRRSGKKLDFLIHSNNGEVIIVECKNPHHLIEVTGAIGQILNYGFLYNQKHKIPFKDLAIVTSCFDPYLPEMIKSYSLPIRIIGLDKTHHLLTEVAHFGH